MSFIYPRTVSVLRFPAIAGVGATGYGGLAAAQQGLIDPRQWPVVVAGLPASIQAYREGGSSAEKLPADAKKPTWKIFIPASALSLIPASLILTVGGVPVTVGGVPVTVGGQPGTTSWIGARDVVADDIRNLYQVITPYWNSLGWQIRAVLLET